MYSLYTNYTGNMDTYKVLEKNWSFLQVKECSDALHAINTIIAASL